MKILYVRQALATYNRMYRLMTVRAQIRLNIVLCMVYAVEPKVCNVISNDVR